MTKSSSDDSGANSEGSGMISTFGGGLVTIGIDFLTAIACFGRSELSTGNCWLTL